MKPKRKRNAERTYEEELKEKRLSAYWYATRELDFMKMPGIVEVNGEQVFNAQWISEQMMYGASCADRTRTIAVISAVMSVISTAISIIAIITAL